MGFRFRRSLRLLPGLRLNVGTGGMSVSAGVPGATMNFSQRGARATFGIPGTGFSWSQSTGGGALPARYRPSAQPGESQLIETVADLEAAMRDPRARVVYRGSGRALSPQQLEAQYRRLANAERKERAQAEVDQLEAELAERLACWRDMPKVPGPEVFRAALRQQPFANPNPAPRAPDLTAARSALHAATEDLVDRETEPAPVGRWVGILVGGLLLSGLGFALAAALFSTQVAIGAVVLGAMSAALGLATLVAAYFVREAGFRRRAATVTALAAARTAEAWPAQEAELHHTHQSEVEAYEAAHRAAEAEWLEGERQRILWASRLLAGEPEAIEDAVVASLEDLDFPFETKADFAVTSGSEGYLHLDLPEIEDVVPATRHRVLADGRLKETKRDEAERNEEYAELACGVGLMMAAAAFAAAPTLETVHVAAYTQREQKGKTKGQVADDYVYVASIPRSGWDTFDPKNVHAAASLRKLGRMEQQANLRLKRLGPKDLPAWVAEFAS
jgi:hypothetical protein